MTELKNRKDTTEHIRCKKIIIIVGENFQRSLTKSKTSEILSGPPWSALILPRFMRLTHCNQGFYLMMTIKICISVDTKVH